MNTTLEIVAIPLNKLIASPINIRKTGGQTIEDLAASIQSHGLLHNLVVTKVKGDKYQVIAGGRRLAALQKLAKEKVLPKTFEVPCRVVDAESGMESSLAENIIRQAMHPADQFDAFRTLVNEGIGVEDVAARFGVTSTIVRQRLKLANVAPQLFELYRTDQITLEQLMALAVTDNHAAQEKVWDSLQEWNRQPGTLRRALTETKVDGGQDRRAHFVGVQTYLNDGGSIERDLFQPEHQGYLTDPAKLDRLVTEKLETIAEQVKSEGWKWVEIIPNADYSELSKFSHMHPSFVETPELRKEIEGLQSEQEKIERAHGDVQEYPADVQSRMDEIDERIEDLNVQARQYTDKDKHLAGAVISIDGIHRGLVRPQDTPKARALKSESNGSHATQGEEEGLTNVGLSGALIEDLTAHRTAALRAALSTRPDVALVAAAHNLALRVCYDDMSETYDIGSALSLATEKGGCSLEPHAKGIDSSIAEKTLSGLHRQWLKRIPAEPEELWQWLIKQEQSVVIELLAFCIGQTVYAVRLPHDSPSQPRFIAADRLAEALKLDMADWWTPTADSYLGRVKKDQIIEAIKEGTHETNVENLRDLKKGELVLNAELRLAKTRWLPNILKEGKL